MNREQLLICLLVFPLSFASQSHSQEKEAPRKITIIDFNGKEHQLSNWKFVKGTRDLSPFIKGNNQSALELCQGTQTPLRNPVLTLVPLENIQAIEFDHKANRVKVQVASQKEPITLIGVTGYIGINVIALESQTDLGELGKAKVKFLGGVRRGIKSLRFSSAKPLPKPSTGRPAVVEIPDKLKSSYQLTNVQALYRNFDRTFSLEPVLFFEKNIKADLNRISKLSRVGVGPAKTGMVFNVALKSGLEKPLVLVQRKVMSKRNFKILVGLVGQGPVGHTLVPVTAINQLIFDRVETKPQPKEPASKGKAKKNG